MIAVLTRPEGRAGETSRRLREAGHTVRFVALQTIVDADPFPNPALFDAVLFTSVSAVERAPRGHAWPAVGAVGPVTAAALRARGIHVDVVGDGGGAALGAQWPKPQGRKILLPQAQDAHPGLAGVLRSRGADITVASVYRTVPRQDVDVAPFHDADLICFFSPSQVRAFRALNVKTDARVWGVGTTTRAAMAGLERHLDALEDVL